MRDVRVTGVGMTPFGKFHERGLKSLTEEAVTTALGDAEISPDEVRTAFVANAVAGLITGQECIRGQVVLRACGIGGIPIVNVENACASSSTAFHLAWSTVASGQAEIALAVGMEKLTHPDKALSLAAFSSAVDVERALEIRDQVNAVAPDGGPDTSTENGGDRSMFMDIYAAGIRNHMQRFGTTREQIANVAVKSHRFGALNPYAQYRKEMTVEEVLSDRPVAMPLTRSMCSPIGDGAAAAVVMSQEAADRHGLGQRPKVLASTLQSADLPARDTPSAERRAVALAYEMAGIGPMDLDVAEVHDATSPAELLAYEDIGLCPPGDGGKLVDEGATDLGGRCPVNTSGGLVSRGHPIGATGLAQIVELVWQLEERCGDRQVPGARIALAQNGGGFMGNDSAAQAVHILAR